MSENQASSAAQQTKAVKQESEAGSQLKVARARSDILSDAEDEHGPSSPHFYSQSVRKSSRSLDSYVSDIENSAPDNAHDIKVDVASQKDAERDQEVHEQAVRLDLLRRQHSARARQTLEHLQNTAVPSSGSQASESPRRGLSETRRSNSGLSVDMVREQSQQLKQASGDLKRLAEEQRTLAEEAVANFLLQEDMMMGEGENSEQQEGSQHAGLSQALNDVFEDNQGNSRTSLTRQLEKIRRAEQAIKDAEADERIADQLAALQLTLSQLAEQEAAVDGGTSAEADTSSSKNHRSESSNKASPTLPAGRHLLKDISENSQEGIDSSIGHSSSSHHSHMAASAFAAVSQVLGFQADPEVDQEDDQDHLKLDGVDSARADEQAAQHEEGQAKSPTAAHGNSKTASQGQQQQAHQLDSTTDRQSAPLTADSLKTLASSTEDDQLSIASAVAAPDQDLLRQSPEPARESAELATAGSTAGSQTFDAELHDSVAALVQAPGNTGTSSQQPTQPPNGVSDPSVDALILQSLKDDVTSPASGSSSHAFDAALQDGVSAAVTTGVTAEPDQTSLVSDSVAPLDSSSSSGLDTAGSSQGALTGTQALGSVTRAVADSPAQEAASARDVAAAPAAEEAVDIPMYTLGSDDEDDLAVVSNVEQAREAQAAADEFIHSSRPATPEGDSSPQYAASHASSLPPAPSGPQQQEEDAQAEAAADTSRPFTSDYLEEGRMADAFEPEEFKGMLFHDGVDSQGRPVIVVNTDAVGTARKARSQALQYMLHRLEPIVTQGPYVLVMVATGQHQKSDKLPAMWLISAYRSLSRPFRKNVRYIMLVRPTGGLKALVACIRPFVSAKAARKVRKVESLAHIAAATSGEVTIQHLGTRFAAAAGDYFLQGAAAQASAENAYDMPQF
ncbi:TPA: hypothetical protein ACH3X1_007113 [Trebouxia sp. C0004]